MTTHRLRFAYSLLCLKALFTGVTADSLKFAANAKSNFELVGGTDANLNIFSAYTVFANGECGGVLVSKNRVLTSAHCVQSGHPDTVRVGATNRTSGIEVGVRCAKSHPLYLWPGFQYDIAVLKLEEDITTVETPTLNVDLGYPRSEGQDLLLAGMGRNTTSGFYSETLEQIRYEFVGEDLCKDIYGSEITRGLHICAYGIKEGACFGDTGGPLFDDVEPRWLVGIATGASGGCADNTVPDVYANVASFADWILDQDTDETCNDECTGCLCAAYEFMGRISTRMSGVSSFFNF